jgi:hypothetical protein
MKITKQNFVGIRGGLNFYRLQAGKVTASGKAVLMK